MNSGEPIKIDLTPAEQDLLVQGLAQWGGPAAPTNELARAIGARAKLNLSRVPRSGHPGTPADRMDLRSVHIGCT